MLRRVEDLDAAAAKGSTAASHFFTLGRTVWLEPHYLAGGRE
jgi:hypothetical protein